MRRGPIQAVRPVRGIRVESGESETVPFRLRVRVRPRPWNPGNRKLSLSVVPFRLSPSLSV